MSFRHWLNSAAGGAFISLTCTATSILAQTSSADENTIRMKLELAEKIFSKSEIPERVMTSGDPNALTELERARSQIKTARNAYEQKQFSFAIEAINTALKALNQLGHQLSENIVRDETPPQEKYQSLYQEIQFYIESIQSRFINYEKAVTSPVKDIEPILDEAVKLAEKNQLEAANELLESVYENVVILLNKVRANETIVYSLSFNTPEEEYMYELERYRSYSILLDLNLQRKRDVRLLKMINHLKENSRQYEEEARQLAENKSFEGAISTMELANSELSKSLRLVGVMMP